MTIKKVLGERVLIKPDDTKEATASGILLPDSAKEQPQIGTIVAIGQGTYGFQVGDRVIFPKYAVLELEGNCLVDAIDILGVIEE